MIALLEMAEKEVIPLSILTREVLEKADSYDEAVDLLSSRPLIAPAYFIVGGVRSNEGIVITRNQYKVGLKIILLTFNSKSIRII